MFILRPDGGHVDVFACFGVQTPSTQPPNSFAGMLLGNVKHAEHDFTHRATVQPPEAVSDPEMLFSFISQGCCF